ncbi:MAG TPA: hypothetical protein VMH28_23835 [Candidatus Acidoferrales bacterium]|nr:hypothetical protein [Candidatus Acidoferrales bacterium]
MSELQIQDAEFYRLLGYPRGLQPEGRAAELTAWVREWYATQGRPWTHSHEANLPERAFVVAASAGPEIEEEAQRRWRDGLPDEYFFLEMYGSAVVEHLTTMAGARLCDWADPQGLAILPHWSPGYAGIDIARQAGLLERLQPLPHPLEVLPSGMLRPKKSQISVFPVVPKTRGTQPLAGLVPCSHCSYTPCQFRRVPQRVNAKALRRWAAERLQLCPRGDGAIEARFRYDGTTCSNLGHPLRFDYVVTLGPRDEGFPIRDEYCAPVDDGYQRMCRYLEAPEATMQAIASEKPMLGHALHEALAWRPPDSLAGCYCDPESRAHKWGLVFETIWYKLHA